MFGDSCAPAGKRGSAATWCRLPTINCERSRSTSARGSPPTTAPMRAAVRRSDAVLPSIERKLRRRGIPGVFLDLEPHLKGGGQFGGFSGPDGMGVALRALCRVLDYVGLDYHLRDFADIQAARGF